MKKEDKMIKIVGVLMIIGSSGFLGRYIYILLKDRRDLLRELISAVDILQAEIVFKRSELCEAFEVICRRIGGKSRIFWSSVTDKLKEGEKLETAFEQSSKHLSARGMTKEDGDILMSFCSVLGRYDSYEQASMLKNIRIMLERQYAQSEKEFSEKGRLYRALGLSIGIIAALVAV